MEVMYRYIQILPTLEGRRLYKGKVPGDHLRILPMLFSYHGALALVQVLSIIYVCVCARARVCVTWERERTCVLCERLDHSDLWAELDWSVKQGSSAIASFYNMNILLCYLVSWTPCVLLYPLPFLSHFEIVGGQQDFHFPSASVFT